MQWDNVLLCLNCALMSVSRVQERRIYELKKKNQELEKFKYVLDYKIKELKKQVGRESLALQARCDSTCTMRDCMYQQLCKLCLRTQQLTQHARCMPFFMLLPTVTRVTTCCCLRLCNGHQIEPREEEIAEMRETIRAMDGELERYHKSNAGLDLTIQNLKLKQAGLQQEVRAQ